MRAAMEIRFKVIDKVVRNPPDDDPGVLYLIRDDWNDYSYRTLFEAYYQGKFVGGVKIAFRGMTTSTPTIDQIPREFESLPDEYYSLWPTVKACQEAYKVLEATGCNIFERLNDIAYDLKRFDGVKGEGACTTSLLREASVTAVRGQLHRVTHGKAALTRYNFSFTLGSAARGGQEQIGFDVVPEELPPSNVHVLIGRNGVGKTHLLKDLALCACGHEDKARGRHLDFPDNDEAGLENRKSTKFANVIVVSFSPFDSYRAVAELAGFSNDVSAFGSNNVPCRFVGLGEGGLETSIKGAFEKDSCKCCAGRTRFERWIGALETLRSDPMFDNTLADVWPIREKYSEFREMLEGRFDNLSSGHKAVLSIVTGCVALLEERTLLLLDEPENHLHPPLLAAFVRTLSELLVDRNSVAVVSTHSPVVLQEVPRSCVWMLNRNGETWFAKRPDIETFGANFESLTTQVFGVEVDKSGFHKMLADAVDGSSSYEEAKERFSCGLGDEATGILRLLWLEKQSGASR